jgi:ABC-type branched-subunit amino acid transport system permease subunit
VFFLACAGALLLAVLGALNLGGIEPFHDRNVALALIFFVLAVVVLGGATMTRPTQAQS